METGWVNWEHFKYHSGKLRADYIKQFEYVLPRVTRQQDSQNFYWPSSPSSGGCFDAPDDENRGDVHYWDVWHGQKPFRDYEKYHFRFCSEFGFQSFPGMKTIKAFTEEADRNIFSRVMEGHQKNPTANGKILSYLSESFLYPKNFESILYVSQILQGLAIKFGVEHWRRHRGRCMGSLYWQLNDNWPVASWSSIDYFGRWKALHYMARTFYAPLAGSIRQSDTEIEVHVQNESLHKKSCYITISLMSFDFKIIAEESVEAEVPALTALKVYGKDYGELVRDRKENCFLRSRFSWMDGYEAEEVAVFVPYKYLLLQRPDYRLDIREEKEYFEISIASDTVTLFTELDLTEKDAVFSDNYFPITDAQGKKVLLFKSEIKNNAQICDSVPMSLEELKEQLKVFSLRESYE
jgi:beta-mannosidase